MYVALLLATSWSYANPGDPPTSLYHLEARLTNQLGETHGLDVGRGHPVLMTMFYGTCPATCPLIVETLRAIEGSVDAGQRASLRVIMISIDPAKDTPAALAALAKTRRIDGARWTLATADEATVRKIAALLNIQYRRLPDGEYNHSNVISVLNARGEIVARSSVLGRADPEILRSLAAR